MSTPRFTNKHLSFSRLKRYEACPRSFELHYVRELPSEPNDALRFGSLLHAVLERLYRWVIEEEYEGRIDEERAVEIYRDEWSHSGLSGVAIYQEGLDILRAYLRDNALVDHRNTLAVEQEFRLSIGPFSLLGYIDRVDRVDDETIAIVDYKTNRNVSTSLRRSLVEFSEQPGCLGRRLSRREIDRWASRPRMARQAPRGAC